MGGGLDRGGGAGVPQRLRRLITDPSQTRSIAGALRRNRWVMLGRRLPNLAEMRVIDLGGLCRDWVNAPVRPQSVVVVNLLPESSEVAWITTVQADVCSLPPDLAGGFDLAFSNSVIEHVGGHARRVQFGDVVRAAAAHYWVQTPDRYFPVEPHWLFPGLQFLPQRARAAVIRHWPLGPVTPDHTSALRDVLEVELLSRTELAFYFPEAEILHERVLGLSKSLVAFR